MPPHIIFHPLADDAGTAQAHLTHEGDRDEWTPGRELVVIQEGGRPRLYRLGAVTRWVRTRLGGTLFNVSLEPARPRLVALDPLPAEVEKDPADGYRLLFSVAPPRGSQPQSSAQAHPCCMGRLHPHGVDERKIVTEWRLRDAPAPLPVAAWSSPRIAL